MTRGMIGRTVLGLWLGCFTAAAAQLPPEVLVDKYLLQAQMLSEEKGHKGALEAMDRIVALQEKHNLTLPEEFSYRYAQTALAAGSVQAAIDSVNRYLAVAGKEGNYYREALGLLVKAEQSLSESAVDQAGASPRELEIEPQPEVVPPAPPQVPKITAAQPAPDCKKWNKRKFFKKATVQDVTACLEAGADPNARGKWQNTPLHWVALNDSKSAPAVIEALLKAGADPMARDKYECTPLHDAARGNENPAVIKVLLKAGGDPNARDKWERTPLHRAARNESKSAPAVIEALLKAGADPTVLDYKDRTPLQEARKRNRKVLRNAWDRLPESQKTAVRKRRESQSGGGGWAALVAGVTGAAIGAAGGLDPGTATELGATIGGSVLTGEAGGSIAGGVSSTPTGADASSSEFDTALRNMENSCGERYRSGFSDQDHGRFYCLDAFARYCALKKGHNQQQLDALRHDFEVLRSQGQESRCPYFGILGGTYNENQTIPQATEPVTEEKPTAPVTPKRRLPTCAGGQEVPIAVAEGRKPGCPPESWCRWDGCRNDECRRRYPKCEPGVLQ